LGVPALGASVVLWSLFALSSRALGETSLTGIDAALLRFATPLPFLLPWLPGLLRAIGSQRFATVVLVLASGLPHFLLMTAGADRTNAALTGLLVPGTVPLFVAMLLFARRGEFVCRRRLAALAAIVAGVGASATAVDAPSSGAGVALLLASGLAWSLYAIGLQQTTLNAPHVMLLVCLMSTLVAAGLAGTGAMSSHLVTGSADLSDVLMFTGLLGLGTGLLSTLCYVVAVKALGGKLAAAGGALSPVVTATAAVPLFGERIGGGLVVGLTLIVVGVASYNLTPTRGPVAAGAEAHAAGRRRAGGPPPSRLVRAA
jgi:drug/metabolite transporter (DMT)-like permease